MRKQYRHTSWPFHKPPQPDPRSSWKHGILLYTMQRSYDALLGTKEPDHRLMGDKVQKEIIPTILSHPPQKKRKKRKSSECCWGWSSVAKHSPSMHETFPGFDGCKFIRIQLGFLNISHHFGWGNFYVVSQVYRYTKSISIKYSIISHEEMYFLGGFRKGWGFCCCFLIE